MRARLGSRPGFTLIELLVVIAIIAILAAILFPIFSQAREAGKRASCQMQMRQIALAMFAYAGDNGGRAPWAYGFSYDNPPVGGVPQPTNRQFIGKIMLRYEGNKEAIWVCPSTPYKDNDIHFWWWRYFYNQWYQSSMTGLTCPDPNSVAGHMLNDTDWKGFNDERDLGHTWKYTPTTKVPLLWDQRYRTWDTAANTYSAKYELIHKGGWNILLLDGHVKFHYEKDRSAYKPIWPN
jgi:prepilin-type N-terminal cleavage/methylation domain-containing protein/prepilin-type processing-associated H-X9-DG protein